MTDRSRIWEPRTRNTLFRSVFAANIRFSVKPQANTWILSENLKFFKTQKTHIWDRYVLPNWNMGIMTKKYGVLVSFCRKFLIFGKTVG
jgi:hypothetical protein